MTFSRRIRTTPALYRESVRASEVPEGPVTSRRRAKPEKLPPVTVLDPALRVGRQQAQGSSA
jgi:hypothetical protein